MREQTLSNSKRPPASRGHGMHGHRVQPVAGTEAFMNENPAASDWGAARGEKWCTQLSGMKSALNPVDDPLIRALQLEAPLRIAEIGCGGGGGGGGGGSRSRSGAV